MDGRAGLAGTRGEVALGRVLRPGQRQERVKRCLEGAPVLSPGMDTLLGVRAEAIPA